MVTDPIADFLIRIKNGYLARKRSIEAPNSTINKGIASLLKREGYIADVTNDFPRMLTVTLKYTGGVPAMEEVVRVSSPGQRVYEKRRKLPYVRTGQGLLIVTTPKGLMTDRQARKANVGGEIICKIW